MCHDIHQGLSAWSPATVILAVAGLFALGSLGSDYSDELRPVSIWLTRSVGPAIRLVPKLVFWSFFSIALIEAMVSMAHTPAVEVRPLTRGLAVLALLVIAVYAIPVRFKVVHAEVYAPRSPASLLRRDRLAACVTFLSPDEAAVAAIWLCCGTNIGIALCMLKAARLVIELLTGGDKASTSLMDTRIWLALTHRMPLRTLTFLEDAHRRGALGRTGSAYQFRHIRLQQRLAQGHDTWLDRVARTALGSLVLDVIPGPPPWTSVWTHPVWAHLFEAQALALGGVIGPCQPIGPVYRAPPGVVQRFGTAVGCATGR
jgi:hypothetical protein